MSDPINPQHYKHLPAEAIDIIMAAIAKAPSNESAYLQGQVLKYLLRCWEKKGIEDLRKAKWYLDRMVNEFDDLLAEASGASETPTAPPKRYREPTQADLRNGPVCCEVREDAVGAEWQPRILFGIDDQAAYPFRVLCARHPDRKSRWPLCRIEVQEPAKRYREPTLEDLKNGPIDCEVLDSGGEQWKAMRLIEIHKSRSGRFGFFCQAERDSPLNCWEQCRIEVTE